MLIKKKKRKIHKVHLLSLRKILKKNSQSKQKNCFSYFFSFFVCLWKEIETKKKAIVALYMYVYCLLHMCCTFLKKFVVWIFRYSLFSFVCLLLFTNKIRVNFISQKIKEKKKKTENIKQKNKTKKKKNIFGISTFPTLQQLQL